jgi:hypothetical protein
MWLIPLVFVDPFVWSCTTWSTTAEVCWVYSYMNSVDLWHVRWSLASMMMWPASEIAHVHVCAHTNETTFAHIKYDHLFGSTHMRTQYYSVTCAARTRSLSPTHQYRPWWYVWWIVSMTPLLSLLRVDYDYQQIPYDALVHVTLWSYRLRTPTFNNQVIDQI